MKSIVLLCMVAMAAAAPASSGDATIVKFENDNGGTGNYHWGYEVSDGTKGEATGEFHPGSGKEDEGFVAVRGSFDWVGTDGVTYSGTYVADENGYHPTYNQGPNGAIPDDVIKAFSGK